MGLFGGDDDNSASNQTNQLLQQQYETNQAELDYKRQALTNQRLAILKSQGAESFEPEPLIGVSEPGSSSMPGASGSSGKGFMGNVIDQIRNSTNGR